MFRAGNRDGQRPFVVAHEKCNQLGGFALAGVGGYSMNFIGGFIESLSNLVDMLRLVIDLAADGAFRHVCEDGAGMAVGRAGRSGLIGDFDTFASR